VDLSAVTKSDKTAPEAFRRFRSVKLASLCELIGFTVPKSRLSGHLNMVAVLAGEALSLFCSQSGSLRYPRRGEECKRQHLGRKSFESAPELDVDDRFLSCRFCFWGGLLMVKTAAIRAACPRRFLTIFRSSLRPVADQFDEECTQAMPSTPFVSRMGSSSFQSLRFRISIVPPWGQLK
jgi:hypothetical protein